MSSRGLQATCNFVPRLFHALTLICVGFLTLPHHSQHHTHPIISQPQLVLTFIGGQFFRKSGMVYALSCLGDPVASLFLQTQVARKVLVVFVVVWLNSNMAKSAQAMNVICTISMLAACLNFTYDSIWTPTEKNLLADAASCCQLNLLLSLAPHLHHKSSSMKSQIIGMKHTLTSRDWLPSSSCMAPPPVPASPTVLVNGLSSVLPSFTLSCLTCQESSCQHQPGSCLSGLRPLATEPCNRRQLNPISLPFIPSMSTKVCLLMLASRKLSTMSSGASSVSMEKKPAVLSFPSCLAPSSNLPLLVGTLATISMLPLMLPSNLPGLCSFTVESSC